MWSQEERTQPTVDECALLSPRRGPCLVVAFDADHPLTPASRHSLVGVTEAVVGRGIGVGEDRQGGGLFIRIEDSRVSTEHVRLIHRGDGFALEDLGSRNGTTVNGRATALARLRDGDLIEVGHTFLLFRAAAEPPPSAPPPHPALATLDGALADELARLARVAPSMISVLLEGETGTGKELTARAIHALSKRHGRFVPVNSGAIPETLVESELFGYRSGAFTGAATDRPGLVRAANGGTLLLDEIGDLAPTSQAALLRVLQEHEVQPLGATRPTAVDLRVVAATNRDLDAMAKRGAFRADLLARLAGYRVTLPPLRERRADLGPIIGTLLRSLAPDREVSFDRRAARALFFHEWPYNIRELQQALAAALFLSQRGRIHLEHLPAAVRSAAPSPRSEPTRSPEETARRDRLVALLEGHGGNVAAVARALGKAPAQVRRWIERYAIDLGAFR